MRSLGLVLLVVSPLVASAQDVIVAIRQAPPPPPPVAVEVQQMPTVRYVAVPPVAYDPPIRLFSLPAAPASYAVVPAREIEYRYGPLGRLRSVRAR